MRFCRCNHCVFFNPQTSNFFPRSSTMTLLSQASIPDPRAIENRPPAVFIMGPTASGKSAVALDIAQYFPVEIISVDSAQVYRGMDIGTAKPDAATRAAIPHHLIDIIDPTQAYSAARFRDDALRLMSEITTRGKIPLLVGGTMLYFRALTTGLSDLPEADIETRKQLAAEAEAKGWPAMHAELATVDPETAVRLKPGDSQRIQRALEIYRLTGSPMASLIGRGERDPLPYRVLKIALIPADRALLHKRIALRFDDMLQLGLVNEVRELRRRHALRQDLPSMRCVGYRQAWEYLDGGASEKELRMRGTAATRQLAKRQLTWLRAMQNIEEFDCLRAGLAAAVAARVRVFLAG
jgi:tRNA dimethylallyltransferase